MRDELTVLRELAVNDYEERSILANYGIVTNQKDKNAEWKKEAEDVMTKFHANRKRHEELLQEYRIFLDQLQGNSK